jgi:hypothetical protein
LIQLIEDKKPKNVQELVNLAKEETSIPEQKIIEHVLQLRRQGRISLRELPAQPPQKLGIYLKTKETYWYWITLILIMATTMSVFTIPENVYPLVYLRYVLGTVFVLLLPGYSFIKALFPKKELDNTERTALSIGMSLALVSITGLLLNYTPWGIRTTPITLSLLALTIAFATAALIREHKTRLKEKL